MFVRKCYHLLTRPWVAHSDVASQKLPRKQRRRIDRLSSSDLQRNVKKQYMQYKIFLSLMFEHKQSASQNFPTFKLSAMDVKPGSLPIMCGSDFLIFPNLWWPKPSVDERKRTFGRQYLLKSWVLVHRPVYQRAFAMIFIR